MREWVKVLPLGLGLPVVIGAASVKPEDAASNLAAWAHLFGVNDTPAWLSNPNIDNRVIFGSLAVAAIYAFLLWGVPALKRQVAQATSVSTSHRTEISAAEDKADLLRKARQLVIDATAQDGVATDFRAALEHSPIYFALRPHLSAQFRERVRAGRTIIVPPPGSHLPGLAHAFLDEIDRIEKPETTAPSPAETVIQSAFEVNGKKITGH